MQVTEFILNLHINSINESEEQKQQSEQPLKKARTNGDQTITMNASLLEGDDFLWRYIQENNTGNDMSLINNPDDDTEMEDELQKLKESIKAEFIDFTNHCGMINWVEMVKKYPTTKYSKDTSDERLRATVVTTKDPIYVGSLFNVLKWWKEEGQMRFPKIALAAMIILGKPYHNGFQERVFSTGTWTDGKLKQRLTSRNLELSVLDKINSERCYNLLSSIKSLTENEGTDDSKYVEQFFETKTNVEPILTVEDINEDNLETVEIDFEDMEDENETDSADET